MYLPPGLFFLNMYYMMGVKTALEMLFCLDDGQGGRYLKADPSMACGTGGHVGYAVIAFVFVFLYLVCVPCLYCWVLFWVLPTAGRDSPMGKAFRFLYGRFLPRVWFWELIESFRKVVFVACTVFSVEPLVQSVGALAAGESVATL